MTATDVPHDDRKQFAGEDQNNKAMMLAIEAQKKKHLGDLSPRSYEGIDQPPSQASSKIDPKNISGGPFNQPPRSDYSAVANRDPLLQAYNQTGGKNEP